MRITAIKGFADILPGEVETRQFIEEKAREVFAAYNFSEIRIPVVEKTELFRRSIGETTDIVEKEMYTFADKDAKGTLLTLRPEGTAGVVRAYLESGLYQTDPVQKLFYMGPMFRRERPQKGRLRQFYQIGAEVLGRKDPQVDAETLLLLDDFFCRIGAAGLTLELNSLGCPQCRPAYREELLAFLRQRQEDLCPNCRNRLERNPLRALDCKEESCIQATRDAPSILGFLCTGCQEHFQSVRDFLQASGVAHRLNPRMVRGLDYYCRTTFEWTSGELGAQNTVAAGGRYDGLVEDLGGPAIAGVGFAMGVERLALILEAKGSRALPRPDLYVAWIGKPAQSWAFPVVGRLRQHGIRIEIDGEEKSLKSQMRRADRLRAVWALLIGEEELRRGSGTLRNLDTKQQVEVKLEEVEAAMLERAAGG